MSDIPAGILAVISLCLVVAGVLTWRGRGALPQARLPALWLAFENYVSSVMLLVMLVACAMQVAVRFVLSEYLTVTWTEELALLAQVWLTFWGAAALHRQQDHLNLALLFDLLSPAWQRAVRIFGDLVVIAVLAPVVWFGFSNARFLDIMSTVSLGVPQSTFAYTVPLFMGLALIYTLAHLAEHLRTPQPLPAPDVAATETFA